MCLRSAHLLNELKPNRAESICEGFYSCRNPSGGDDSHEGKGGDDGDSSNEDSCASSRVAGF